MKGVSFSIDANTLKFWTKDKVTKAEPGKFNVWVGRNSQEGLMGSFELLPSSNE
jgi:beta-glucosidase